MRTRQMAERVAVCTLLVLGASSAFGQPTTEVDLLDFPTSNGALSRVLGSAGDGSFGVPVAGGFDCDGDSHVDTAFSAMLADPLSRQDAGEIYLVFGDGSITGTLDTATVQAGILRIAGEGVQEHAGSEIWMDDVTGDDVGDLLIARQDFTTGGRIGAGALSIIVGGGALRTHAATLDYFDLGSPPAGTQVTTLIGANALDRLGIWVRTGDVTGDGIADIVVGADQTENASETHAGAVFVIRGGSHLAANETIDLAEFGTVAFESSPLSGHTARIVPPTGSTHYHFGSTCQIADLDDNGTAEVLVATALNRAGAVLRGFGAPPGSAHASGGSPDGSAFIIWDDNFPAGNWDAQGLALDAGSLPGTRTLINGGANNISFGEELLGGLDFDLDGNADLFVGDIVGDLSPMMDRGASGSGHVFYNAATLKGETFDLDNPPMGLVTTTIAGAAFGDIAGDTAAQGDFDGDGTGDLAFSAPHGTPFGRTRAGIVYVFFGQSGVWPSYVDLLPANMPTPEQLRFTALYGAFGESGSDAGDTLSYSAAAGDVDGDGKTDLITNEMLGNGSSPAAEDKGNLIVVSGARLGGQTCPLDVDANGVVEANTDGVYTYRGLLGLGFVVPPDFRTVDPSIASDETVAANVAAMGDDLDVDEDGTEQAATDGVYVYRRLLGLQNVVPPDFRTVDPTIPSDETIGANVDALCP